jgi:hypothetical protein
MDKVQKSRLKFLPLWFQVSVEKVRRNSPWALSPQTNSIHWLLLSSARRSLALAIHMEVPGFESGTIQCGSFLISRRRYHLWHSGNFENDRIPGQHRGSYSLLSCKSPSSDHREYSVSIAEPYLQIWKHGGGQDGQRLVQRHRRQ